MKNLKYKQIFKSSFYLMSTLHLYWIFLFFSNNIYSQYYIGDIIDTSNGIPHNEINDIVKDKNNYVWIATENGLSRYDGYNFINFNSKSHPHIFKDNRIKSIQQNGDYLYLLTNADGLIQLDLKKLLFRKIYNSNPLSIAFSGDTTAILFDNGKLIIEIKNKKTKELTFNVSPPDNLLIYKENIFLCLKNKGGILKFQIKNPNKTIFIPVEGFYNSGKLLLSKKYGIVYHNGHIVRIIKNDYLVEHPEMKGRKQINFFKEDEFGRIMFIEKYRTLNVIINNQFFCLLFGTFENYQYKQILRLTENSFLIGSNQGISRINKNPSLSENIKDVSILKDNIITVRRSILENNNKRFFLSHPYIIEQDKSELKNLTNIILPIADGVIFENKIFFATDGNGLISVDLKTKKMEPHGCDVIKPKDSFEDISIFSDTYLILTGSNRVVLYNPKTNEGKDYSLKTGTVIHVAVQKKNSNIIYLGTNIGVIRIRFTAKKEFELIDMKGHSDIDVRDILIREKQNEMWLATSKGVLVMDLKKSKIIKSYSKDSEVSNLNVVKLIEDKNNCIWASTYSGITVYNTINSDIYFINKNHGIINSEFNYKSGCILNNGNIIFGGLNAYELIKPNLLAEYNYSSLLLISGIETIQNENSKRFTNYTEGNTISFNTGKEMLKIYLTNLDFQFGDGYTFQYNFDSKNWLKTDKKKFIVLSNISYGNYNLKIRMFNPFGQLVSEKSFKLSAEAPFYVKTEFYILIIFLILFFFVLVIIFYIKSFKIKSETKSKIAMDLHDESGTILTRLLLLSKKEIFGTNEKEKLQNGLKEALYSFRTYLDSISRENKTAENLSDELLEFVTSSCDEAKIALDFEKDFEKDYPLRSELFRDIKLTVYEIVTNVIKHSNASQLYLIFSLKKRKLQIIISDNGNCNIYELDTMKGNGIRNIKKRISRNSGTYSYYLTSESGLTVEINIPI
jgi:two-component sensor histidine kinase